MQTTSRPGARAARPERRQLRLPSVRVGDLARWIALAAVLLGLFEAVADLLPDEPVVSVLTPLRLVIALGLVAALVAAAVDGVALSAIRTRLDGPIVVLVLASSLAAFWVGIDMSGVRGLITAVGFYYLVVGTRRVWPGSELALAQAALLGVVVASAVALGQAAAQTPTGFCRIGFADVSCKAPDAAIRVIGTFSNPNLLAAFLILLLPLAVYAATVAVERGSAAVAWAGVVAGLVALWCTHSRGGLVALTASAVLAGFIWLSWSAPRWLRVLGGLAVAGVAAVAVGAGIGIRADIWRAAVGTALDHPMGVGIGRAGAAISTRIGDGRDYAHAHDLWLNWLVEAGVVGGAAVGVLTLFVALRLHDAVRVRPDGTLSGIAIALCASAGGFAVLTLADHPTNAVRIALVMWMVLGMAEATGPMRDRRAARGRRVAGKPEGRRALRVPEQGSRA